MVPEFTISLPALGNRWAVGIAFLVHISIVAFVIGIALVAPTAELLGLRQGGERWRWLAYGLGSTIIRLFAFGATWVVFALMLIYGLYPSLWGVLVGIFFWPLVAVGILWFTMTVTAYAYYITWDRLGQGSWPHMAIGWTFAGATLLFITIITWLDSFMLTPTNPNELFVAAINPSWPTEIIHRHIGNLSYAALILAGYAGLRTFFFPRSTAKDRANYDWLGDWALLLGLGLALLQPIVGWFYARQVQIGSPGAYQLMMLGANSWLFLVQSFFVGALVFLGNAYLALGIDRGNPGAGIRTWTRVSLWIIMALLLLLVVPSGFPLGQMRPWKYISLGGFIVISAINLAFYLRTRPTFAWGTGSRRQQMALSAVGIAIIALMVTMGSIKATARGEYLIYGKLSTDQAQEIKRP